MGSLPDHTFELVQTMKILLSGLTIKQRRALRRRIERLPMTNSDSARASAARRKLRRQLAE
jgi:hypothetical protein